MAIIKDIIATSGVNANFHRISYVFVNSRPPLKDVYNCQCTLQSFLNKAAFTDGKAPIQELTFEGLNHDKAAASTAHAQCYIQIMAGPDFDGAISDEV